MKLAKINRKAQEEMVGFVLIVVIVSIILLVFLGIFVRNRSPTVSNDAGDLSQFLDSIMEYTSKCMVNEPNYAKVGELVSYCNSKDLCSNGNSTCSVLNETLQGILNASLGMLNIGPGRPYSGYVLNITYNENVSSWISRELLIESYGNCSSSYRGSREYLAPADRGTVVSSFRVCY
jgi:hypothetical protein